MSRTAFRLSDDEARVLVAELRDLEAVHPVDQRDHRPFVRGFIRAVHTATGKTFSPAIYRRLLGGYAPERRPSNSTLALEKKAFVEQLDMSGAVAAELATVPAQNLAALLQAVVRDALGERTAAPAPLRDMRGDAQLDYLAARLVDVERQFNELQGQAARLAADLQAERAVGEALKSEMTAARSTMAELVRANAKLTEASDGARLFAMRAIDDARTETRVYRERCAQAEAQQKQDNVMLDTYRRAAGSNAAAHGQRKDGV